MSDKVYLATEQLFDRLHDPAEQYDLVNEPAWTPVLELWRTRLVDTLKDRPEGFSDGKRLIAGREYKKILPFLEKYKV